MAVVAEAIELQGQQLVALDYALNKKKRLVAITGAAGTGKTSIMREITRRLKATNVSVALAAPTGKAARRITEATGYTAVTLHKLLGFGKPTLDPETGIPITVTKPKYDHYNRLPVQVVMVDEYAMVHESLHRDLIDALDNGAKLIVFGDIDQLPPIEEYEIKKLNGEEYKSPFERLLELPSSVVLDTVYRQAADSGILFNAGLIRRGKPPSRKSDFIIHVSDVPLKTLKDLVNKGETDFSSLENQVIVPVKVTDIGTYKVNTILQAILNPRGLHGLPLPRMKHEEKHPVSVNVGDKVVCMENMYDMRDYFSRYSSWKDEFTPVYSSFIPAPETYSMLNGEIGLITEIDSGTLWVDFGDRTVCIPESYRDINQYRKMVNVDPRKRISLAYAITTHKAQGSEFDTIVYMQHSVCSWMLSRNNVYTGITRARKLVHFITDARQYQNSMRLTAKQKMVLMSTVKRV